MAYQLPPLPPNISVKAPPPSGVSSESPENIIKPLGDTGGAQDIQLQQWLHEVVKKVETVLDDTSTASDSDLLEGNDSAYHLARANHTGTEADAAITESSVVQHEAAIDHIAIQSIGSNSHTQIDTHLADSSVHTEDNLLVHLAGTETITGTKTFSEIIDSDKGISFPATQVASADANTLDDYEEGTFTPRIDGTSTAGSGTYIQQRGTYQKNGNTVALRIYIVWTAHTGTGSLRLEGLPFTNKDLEFSSVALWKSGITMTADMYMVGYVSKNASYIELNETPIGGVAGGSSLIAMDTAGNLMAAGHYEVA